MSSRAKWIILVIIIAIVGLGIWQWEFVYTMYQRVAVKDELNDDLETERRYQESLLERDREEAKTNLVPLGGILDEIRDGEIVFRYKSETTNRDFRYITYEERIGIIDSDTQFYRLNSDNTETQINLSDIEIGSNVIVHTTEDQSVFKRVKVLYLYDLD